MFRIEPTYQDLLRRAGIADAWSVFENPRIRVWRSIIERENATLDVPAADGSITRLHIKRDKEPQHESSAGAEAAHLLALSNRGIPTPPLVAYGKLPDGRSFVITEDLHGYAAADRQIAAGAMTFGDLLEPVALLAGRLHGSAAFHRDLYLCHFFVRRRADGVDVRLIDCARVLIKPFWRRRWQIKDLAQFTYSTREHSVSPVELDRWFEVYGAALGRAVSPSARRMIDLKADWIARHDAVLRRRQPERNVAIPD